MSTQCLCVKRVTKEVSSTSSMSAVLSASPCMISSKSAAESSVSADLIKDVNLTATATSNDHIQTTTYRSQIRLPRLIGDLGFTSKPTAEAEIRARNISDLGIIYEFSAVGGMQVTNVGKFAGTFKDYGCSQKLYPIGDIETSISGSYFVNEKIESGNLYQSIDEGVYTGNFAKQGGVSDLISDDLNTFITPSAIQTEGYFRYKCAVGKPITAKESTLVLRAAAPTENRVSQTPPQYTLYNIKLEDPAGSLLIKYDDIVIRGDSDFSAGPIKNWGTYASQPTDNRFLLNPWEDGYPSLDDSSGYTLNFDVVVKDFDDPFDEGFDVGFEENDLVYDSSADTNNYLSLGGSPLSTTFQGYINPNNALRISAIEICNSGAYDVAVGDRLNLFLDVQPTGNRLQRVIKPTEVKVATFDTGIYPASSSVWSNSVTADTNETKAGAAKLLDIITNENENDFISMQSTFGVVDSGKLILEFGHQTPLGVFGLMDGEFGFGVPISGDFSTAGKGILPVFDNFFVVDSISLKVTAKKEAGSRDYAIDVVGYSDDKILNITPASGGFLQNTTGTGTIPTSSGFIDSDVSAISAEALSSADEYYETNLTNNSGGDHYLLPSPVVSGTSFAEYEVPLKVYTDTVTLGKSRDYSVSSFFERINLDIYPLPSGASISSIELSVNFAPSDAFKLHTIGYEGIQLISDNLGEESKIYPSSRQSTDSMLNTGSGYAPLSKIESIPHAFKTPDTLKSNYSRRWRGIDGETTSPYSRGFGLAFTRTYLDSPFISGYFDFNYDNGTNILPRAGSLNGTLTSTYATHHIENVGLRFQNSSLFSSQLPSHTYDYETIDWTALSNGGDNFQDHELYGRISDGYNNAVRISGINSYINFGDVDIDQAFSMFIRFSPDVNVSGDSHNLFNSGVLISKWDNGNDLEFLLGYEDEKLAFIAKGADGTTYKVSDTVDYSGYYYPLSVIATYQSGDPYPLKLYTDNECEPGWSTLRASGGAGLELNLGNSALRLGNSPGSGVGMNMFVTDFGLSNEENIKDTGAILEFHQVNADSFLANHRVKFWASGESYSDDTFQLWDRINEDTREWTLGAFKYCEFSPSFVSFSKRAGEDFVRFNIKHDGSSYIDKADKSMPVNVSSGVAYHTQLENDFLRFNLTDSHDRLHSIGPRVSKNLPRGYSFSERALVVETVIEHVTNNDITWDDGTIGPKLIVSLYTKNQDPAHYSAENFGLINRAIHNLEPSGCIHRIDSTFDYDSFTDTSEPWAVYPTDRMLTEMDSKYTDKDIDKMFLQYDLVYPSGPAFESRLDIHSAHIRLEHSFVKASGLDNLLSGSGTILHTSGELRPRESMNLHFLGSSGIDNLWGTVGTSGMFLHTVYSPTGINSQMNLSVSGRSASSDGLMNLHLSSISGISSNLNMYVSGEPRAFSSINAYLHNTFELSSGNLPMTVYTPVQSGTRSHMPLSVFSLANQKAKVSGSMSLHADGSEALLNRLISGNMNLTLFGPKKPSSNMNLFLANIPVAQTGSGNVNFHTISHSLESGVNHFAWDGRNYGQEITVDDNTFASKDADDEIRGVEIICHGSCDSSSSEKCNESNIVTHETEWIGSECIDGGIFRAERTYTNLSHSYSGDYYGIRKYSGLSPNTAYQVTLKGQEGSTTPITPPREWEEWEYGTNEELNFSGVKMLGDYPHPESSNGRNKGDGYGKSVAVNGDMMLVGAPSHKLDDLGSESLEDAGAVFAYTRETTPSGGIKHDWKFAQKIVLPSGYRNAYYVADPSGAKPAGQYVETRAWQVGQKGREFGHSVAIGASGDRQVAVIGAPGAVWSGVFDEIETSGVTIGAMVITDEFNPKPLDIKGIAAKIREKNQILRYFASPAVEINLKLIVCETKPFETKGHSLPPWVIHQKIDRNNVDGATTESILSGIKAGFNKAFPYDGDLAYSGLPPILGIYIDPTPSFGRDSVEPAIDQFKQYYRDYTFTSGVKDFYGVQNSGIVHEHFPTEEEKDAYGNIPDNWQHYAKTVINEILDSGVLNANGGYSLITSGVGPEFVNPDLSEFNTPAESGGRVYVYERIGSGTWDLIQEIESPAEALNVKVDRFGHSVAISENCEVISVGSPYMFENNCMVFEYKPDQSIKLHDSLLSWMKYRNNSNDYDTAISNYGEYSETLGARAAAKKVYSELSAYDRFKFRKDEEFFESIGIETPSGQAMPLEEYKNIYKYSYADIVYTGTWRFVADEFTGTSRLGYSTTINEDGSMVAFGAPTDSFNENDDTNAYFRPSGWLSYGTPPTPRHYMSSDGWASTTNTGAVRLFESRKYHPHSGVVEYYKFGNLHRSLNPHLESSGTFDLSGIFSVDKRDFTKTAFTDVDIPDSAGLAFVITPEVDAASDEVIGKIKSWMSLGDRNLVLVGNDPVWEQDGAYAKSNDVVNRILEKLGSEMRLHPARNLQESLPNCPPSGKPNTIQSKDPVYTRSTDIMRGGVYAMGVADIRLHLPVWDEKIAEFGEAYFGDCDKFNKTCPIPMINNGDLRAEKVIECKGQDGKLRREYINWPYAFGNGSAGCHPKPWTQGIIGRSNQEPKPLVAAAEYLPASSIVYPAYETTKMVPVYETKTIEKNKTVTTYKFSDSPLDKSFELVEPSSTGISSFLDANYINPEDYLGRDSIAQAVGSTKSDIITENKRVLNGCPVVAEQDWAYLSNKSKVVLIASVTSEERENLYAGDDESILFYTNLARKACPDQKSRIAQVGGWTNRTSFSDAKEDTAIKVMLESKGHAITEGVEGKINSFYDICWIANPNGFADEADINYIKDFLNEGDKTLVITYDSDQTIARYVHSLCNDLELDMKPLYLNNLKKYATMSRDHLSGSNNQTVNGESLIIKGCKPSHKATKFYIDNGKTYADFIPIKATDTAKYVVRTDSAIRDIVSRTETRWQIKGGVATLTAPVLAGSGYRLFYNWVSEDDTENFPIRIFADSVNISPDPRDDDTQGISLLDYDENDSPFTVSENVTMSGTMSKTSLGRIKSGYLDFRMPSDSDVLNVYFDSNDLFAADSGDINYQPHTVRLFSASGCLLPITSTTKTTTTTEKKTVQVGWKKVVEKHPEVVITIPEKFQPIKTDASKYCGDGVDVGTCSNGTIDDGPIIIAEEVEKFSSFPAGAERSKIVLISDATLIQNDCLGRTEEQDDFIKSLYPRSMDTLNAFTTSKYIDINGRDFSHTQKIKAPELGSPFRFYAASGLAGLGILFDGVSIRPSSQIFDEPINPAMNTVDRPPTPEKESDKNKERNKFVSRVSALTGGSPLFSGVPHSLDIDARIDGGFPSVMVASGYDYLNSEVFQSGYPGDLFGFSIDLSNNDLVVGTPYNGYEGETVKEWSSLTFFGEDESGVVSGIDLCGKGGAGAVFHYSKTGSGVDSEGLLTPWQFKGKIKPSSVNAGIVNFTSLPDASVLLGSNNYTAADLSDMMISPDEFGYSVSMDADFLVVGAPRHNYENYHEHIYDDGPFIRKAFNAEFDIPTHNVYDLGTSGVRVDQLSGSGTTVINNGAAFTFEHKLQSWKTGEKKWQYAEKIVAQGNNARKQKSYTSDPSPVAISGSESDHFGESVSIHRARRTDGDYTLTVGAPHHMFSSGNVASDEPLLDAGAAYTYDAMLRGQPKVTPVAGSFIEAKVYGSNSGISNVSMIINQPSSGTPSEHLASGLVFSNADGEVFLEASGRDLSVDNGFIKQRPYMVSVHGFMPTGTVSYAAMRMHISGKPPIDSGNINLYMKGPESASVYNTMGLHTASRYDASGSVNLALWNPSGISTSGSMNLHVSGATFGSSKMNIRIRGK